MKCAVYIRVSTEMESQTTSLQNQKDMFINYIAEQGWELYNIYQDRETGTHGRRKGLIQLIEDAELKKFDIIIAKELSRIARNSEISIRLKKIVLNNNIHLKTFDNAIDTLSGDIGKFGLYSWLYENESRQTSQRIKAAQKSKALRGEFVNGDPPYGYKLEQNKLYIREDETPNIVRKIFKMYLSGYGFDYIAKYLTQKGYRTPSFVKGKRNAGMKWWGSTVRVILENRHYVGDLVQCRETSIDITVKKRKKTEAPIIIEGTHVPIISKEDYYAVQRLIKQKTSTKRATPKKHLFTDILFCSDCNNKLWYMQSRKGYLCGNFRKYGKEFCSSHVIKEEVIIHDLKKDLREYVNKISKNIDIIDEFEKRLLVNKKKQEKIESQLKRKKEKIKIQKGQLVLKFSTGDIQKDEYNIAIEILNRDIIEIEKQLIELKDEKKNNNIVDFKNYKKELEKFLDFKEINREVINRFVEKIIVYDKGELEIHYKFKI